MDQNIWPSDAAGERRLNMLRKWRGDLSEKPDAVVIGIIWFVKLKGLRQGLPSLGGNHISILQLFDFDNHGPVKDGKSLIERRGQWLSVGLRPTNSAEGQVLQHQLTYFRVPNPANQLGYFQAIEQVP